MNRKEWSRAKEVFDEALERPHHKREQFVWATCGDNKQLADEVLSLLTAYEQTGPLDRPSDDIGEEVLRQWKKNKKEMKGVRIGAYRILEEIGQGGMGRVFLAERADDQFDKQVALKLLATGLVTEPQMDRFLDERQILASLNHPNIATLLDGGITDDGQPWFVMEYIDGTPIHNYCSRKKLKANERLELFITVCNAVQFAHQNLVIHRDLKPANIMVTNSGIIKLLDFGIANVMEESGGGSTQSTQTERNLTPAYASPEQLMGESISTASDIYQLGTILFELLTGRLLQEEPDREKRTEEIKRSLSEALSKREFNRELGAIIRKSVESNPALRYESAEQFGADIGRYLNNQPLQARPSSNIYQFRKFLERHPTGISAITVIFLILIGYAITVTWYSNKMQMALEKAEKESQKSAQVTEFLMGMFEGGDPAEASGDTVTAQTLLQRGIAQAEELNDQPEVQAEMYSVIGKVYHQLGDYSQAVNQLQKSIRLKRLQGQKGAELANTYYSMGNAMHHTGHYGESDQYFQKAVAIYSDMEGYQSKSYANSLYTLARIGAIRGNLSEAEMLYKNALRMHQEISVGGNVDIAKSLHGVGRVLHLQDQHNQGFRYLNRAMEMFETLYDKPHPEVASLQLTMGRVHEKMNRKLKAEESFINAIDIQKKIYGEHHTKTLIAKKALADFFSSQKMFEKAEQIYLNIYRTENTQQASSPLLRPTAQGLAEMYIQMEEVARAEPYQKQVVALLEESLASDHPRLISARKTYSEIVKQISNQDQTEEKFAEYP